MVHSYRLSEALFLKGRVSGFTFLFVPQQPQLGQVLNIIEASRSYSDTPHHFSGGVISPTQRLLPDNNSSRDGYAEGEHVNRGRDTPSFCPTLQMLDMSILGDAADVNPVIKFLPHTCNFITGLISAASPRVEISSTCKVGQKLGVSLPLLTCSLSA